MLRACEAEDRPATDAEQEILAAWSSWGALPEVFEGWREDWAGVQEQVAAALSPAERDAASTTTLNAHYTDPAVVAEVWRALERAGFAGGPVLEPGCGSGTFIGLAPTGAQMIGVELDPTTARIASLLYPDAAIRAEGFETTRLAGQVHAAVGNVPFGGFSLYDPLDNPRGLSIHNHFIVKALKATAPGGYVAVITSSFTMDAKRTTARREIARYGELLGAVRLPTGAFSRVAGTDVVTDLLVLRRRDPEASVAAASRAWTQTATCIVDDVEHDVSAYWLAHPSHVLGALRTGSGIYGAATLLVDGPRGAELAEPLREVLAGIVDTAAGAGLGYAPTVSEPLAAHQVRGGLHLPTRPEDEVVVGHLRANGADFETWSGASWTPAKVPATQRAETRALLALRDAAVELVAAQRAESTTEQRDHLRAELAARYERYAGTYGPINRFELVAGRTVTEAQIERYVAANTRTWRAALDVPAAEREGFDPPADLVDSWRAEAAETATWVRKQKHLVPLRKDPEFALVLALELFDPETGQARRSRIFFEDVVGRAEQRTSARDVGDALAIAMDETRVVDVARIAELLGLSQDEARTELRGLVFTDPATGHLEPAATYLAGNVRAKLARAQAAAERDPTFGENVRALGEVLPEWVDLAEVVVRPGVRYIDPRDYEAFILEVFKASAVVRDTPSAGTWEIEGPERTRLNAGVDLRYGVAKRSPLELLEAVMNNAPVTITKVVDGPDGRERTVRDVQATTLAREKCELITRDFATWLLVDEERRARIEVAYNGRFNAHRVPDYTSLGQHLALDGLGAAFTPHHYQRTAVARALHEPTVLLDHVVGAGKSGTMFMTAMELRRTGLARKPWLVVPNHLVEQVAAEWKSWYPAARVMAIPTGCGPAERREWIARSALSDWDGVVVPASVFERINVDPARSAAWLAERVAQMRAELAEAAETDGRRAATRVKRIERDIKSIEEKYVRAADLKDPGLTFESTGCDYLFVDEAHNYKNLARTSAHPELACTPGAQRAFDLSFKLRALRESKTEQRARDGFDVADYLPAVATFATGTPVANTLSEMWVMQHYLRPDLLALAGVESVDAWAVQFTQTESKLELGPDGTTWRMKDRVARFANVPELLALTASFSSVVGREDITAALPELVGGERRLVSRPASEPVAAFIKDLAHRANNLPRDPAEDNLLKITHEGRMAALDPRMMGLPADPGDGRLGDVADQIMRIHAAGAERVFTDALGNPEPVPGVLQIVFADRGTPKDDGTFSVYTELRNVLAARGMPPERVRFVHEARTDEERAALFTACREGRVSVLVGSTEKMGTGVNVQKRAAALHHLDCPYRPADLEQREGRIIRQGNQVPEVEICNYVTEGTYDAVMWQMVARKAAFIAQIKRAGSTGRVVEDLSDDMTISAAAASAVATGDPRIIERAEVMHHVARLETLEGAWRGEVASLERDRRVERAAAQRMGERLAVLRTVTANLRSTVGTAFAIRIGDRHYTERSAAAEVLTGVLVRGFAAMEAGTQKAVDGVELGGVGLRFTPALTGRSLIAHLVADAEHQVRIDLTEQIGTAEGRRGIITRCENLVAAIPGQVEALMVRHQRRLERAAELDQAPVPVFERAAGLTSLRARLVALDAALDLSEDPDDAGDVVDPGQGRIEGADLARIVAGRLSDRDLRAGDIVRTRKVGLWQVEPLTHSWHRVAFRVGDGEGAERFQIDGPVDLVSRLQDALTPYERAALASGKSDETNVSSHLLRVGDRITAMTRAMALREGRPVTPDPRPEAELRTGVLGRREGSAWWLAEDDGSEHLVMVQGLAVRYGTARAPMPIGAAALPGDMLLVDDVEAGLPAGTMLDGGHLALRPDGTRVRAGLSPFAPDPSSVAPGRMLTDQERAALDLDEIDLSDLRLGDVVSSAALDPATAIDVPVLVDHAGYGTVRDFRYRPLSDPGAPPTSCSRRISGTIKLLGRRAGALTDAERRRLVDPDVEILGTYSELSGHIGQHLAVAGRRGREYDSLPEVLVGTLRDARETVIRHGSGRAITAQVETADGLEELAVLEHVFAHTGSRVPGEYELASAPDLLAAGGTSAGAAGAPRLLTEVDVDHHLAPSGTQVGPGM